jgi:hypothetical protein
VLAHYRPVVVTAWAYAAGVAEIVMTVTPLAKQVGS